MPRYFFHLTNGHETIYDRDGVEMAEGDAEQLGTIIDEICSENPELFDTDQDWWIEVVDQDGCRVASFPLRR
jgi:hypothetical protein